jgi:hypothetical protein
MLAASADNEALMRCHHVKKNIDRMTVDGCALTEISFSTCPPQFSERYRQTRRPLRISTASVWDTYEESSLDGELCKGWAKGVPLRVLPPWLETSRTYMRVPDPTMSLFPIRRMGHSEWINTCPVQYTSFTDGSWIS